MALIYKDLKYGESFGLALSSPTPEHGIWFKTEDGAVGAAPAEIEIDRIDLPAPNPTLYHPLEMSPSYLYRCAERALIRGYFDGADLAEAKIQIACRGVFDLDQIVVFRYGLKGKIVEADMKIGGVDCAAVEVFLADFRAMWNGLTTAQQFDEE